MPVNLNEAIANALTITRSEWSPVADVTRRFDSDLSLVPVAVGEFNQVVLNLIVNAAHAVAERQANEPDLIGQIEIATSQNESYAQVVIIDNGVGMTNEVREKIFDPFFTTKPVGKGTGQGLALVHHFVAAHGGKIQVNSKPGAGTSITLQLPKSANGPAKDPNSPSLLNQRKSAS